MGSSLETRHFFLRNLGCAQDQGSSWQSEEKDLSAMNKLGEQQQQPSTNLCRGDKGGRKGAEAAQRHSLLKSGTEIAICSYRAGASIPDCPDENAHGSVSLA